MSRVRRSSIWAKLKSKSEPSLVHVWKESKFNTIQPSCSSFSASIITRRIIVSPHRLEDTKRRMWSSSGQARDGKSDSIVDSLLEHTNYREEKQVTPKTQSFL